MQESFKKDLAAFAALARRITAANAGQGSVPGTKSHFYAHMQLAMEVGIIDSQMPHHGENVSEVARDIGKNRATVRKMLHRTSFHQRKKKASSEQRPLDQVDFASTATKEAV